MNLLLNVTYWYHILDDSKIYKNILYEKNRKQLPDFKLNKEYGMKTEIFEGKIKCCNSVAYTKDS